ncbi:MFS transporter [Paractinoplanes globisporus]|uniref:MFS transporter n=1 Tax=Paractinoplanes globisporus TaxID=113565 RepID=A0ABW6WAN7_9ACTN|nr:MFS transporter [Actinoplanes globisporus]
MTEPRVAHRAILLSLSGIILGGFVGNLSSTIVATSLPRVMASLNGSVRDYTWVVVTYLLMLTVTVPIWGKLADLFDKKRLFVTAMSVYLAGSACAGLAINPAMLIGARTLQGIGTGGLTALGGTIVAAIVSPRMRGRYSSYNGISIAVGTISGPLIGGLLVETPVVGWRACFYVSLPLGLAAMWLVHRHVEVPNRPGRSRVDVLGAVLVVGAVVPLMLWLSLGDDVFAWWSAPAVALLLAGVLLSIAFVVVERRVADPLLPLRMFSHRVIALTVVGSLVAGMVSLGAPIFIAQFLQIGRGLAPTTAGLATIPLIAGSFSGIFFGGRLISRLGVLKPFLVAGAVCQLVGAALLAVSAASMPYAVIAADLFVLGIGVGILQQHVIIAVQNALPAHQLGVGTASLWFARFLGGAAGVAALGAVLKAVIAGRVQDGAARIGVAMTYDQATEVPNLGRIGDALAGVYEHAYSTAFGVIFAVIAPLTLITLGCIALMPEVPMHDRVPVVEEEPVAQH